MKKFNLFKIFKGKKYSCVTCGEIFEFKENPFIEYNTPKKPICPKCGCLAVREVAM